MSYLREFHKLAGQQPKGWKLETAAVDPFELLLAKHLTSDVKMNQRDGYVPAASVLAQREYHRQYDELEKIGKTARGDYWQEWSGKDKVQCGFRDNRDKGLYSSAMSRLSELLGAKGYRIAVRPSGATVTLDKALATRVQAKHDDWLAAMEKAGATIREDRAVPDEGFAAEFAAHRKAEGHPLPLEAWKATMKLALEQNLAPEKTDYRYNKFDLDKVAATLAPFGNLSYTPAREFAPVLYVTGPTETLATIAKVAEKKLGAYEAKMSSRSTLRIAWD